MKQSQDYHIRYLFLVVCNNAIGIFSSRYFCEYFLYSIIDLYRDPIPNIRIYLCELLMSIRHCLFLFDDSSIIQKFNVITNSLIIRNSNDVDLNNTNNIIKDILNYPELQRNNKYVLNKTLPKDSSSLTIDFFMNNDDGTASKRNSIKPNCPPNNKTPIKKASSIKKQSIDTESTKTKSLNGKKSNIPIEVASSNKPTNVIKKFVLPVNDTEWYKNIYYKEIYNTIDEINFDNLISEDQTKEKNESHLFHATSDQAKKNKNSLLDHFKYNNINQFGKQVHNNKPIIKNSIEMLSGNDAKSNVGKITSSSLKNDQYNITNKTKSSKNSIASSVKSEYSYSSQKYKKLGDEKSTLKPKTIGNSGNGKY